MARRPAGRLSPSLTTVFGAKIQRAKPKSDDRYSKEQPVAASRLIRPLQRGIFSARASFEKLEDRRQRIHCHLLAHAIDTWWSKVVERNRQRPWYRSKKALDTGGKKSGNSSHAPVEFGNRQTSRKYGDRSEKEIAMRYVCLVYLEEEKMQALSPEEGKALDRESIAYDEELRTSGHYLASDALLPVTSAVTIRKSGGALTMTDGPFAETKEHLGGFILIEAVDLNEAIRIASNIPVGRYGAIEVRPVMELDIS